MCRALDFNFKNKFSSLRHNFPDVIRFEFLIEMVYHHWILNKHTISLACNSCKMSWCLLLTFIITVSGFCFLDTLVRNSKIKGVSFFRNLLGEHCGLNRNDFDLNIRKIMITKHPEKCSRYPRGKHQSENKKKIKTKI